jgi:hypothetical protein
VRSMGVDAPAHFLINSLPKIETKDGGSMPTKTFPRTHRALVNALDRLGRPIEASVLSVAQAIAPKAVSYAQKSLADPCVAMNLLEEAAATVSEAVLAKQLGDLVWSKNSNGLRRHNLRFPRFSSNRFR